MILLSKYVEPLLDFWRRHACPNENHPGPEVTHVESFPIGKKAALRRISYHPTKEKVDREFPFLLMTGRTLHQFNAGTMTMRTRNRKLRPTDVFEIAPSDANGYSFIKPITCWSKVVTGRPRCQIHITRRVKPGELFATFHDAAVFLNRVTRPHRDRCVKSREYKVTVVRIEPILN